MKTRATAGILSGALVALAVSSVAPASAAEGPAPSPQDRTVIADVHTDTISTFIDDGQLVLGSKADIPDTHTRYDADTTWFHVDNDSKTTVPPVATYEFIAPQGADIWLAGQIQAADQIWPGFSTESVPAGVLDNNDITFTLADVEGPGEVELWLTGTFGGVGSRLWSSDEAHTSFTRKSNVHMHANWAFTAPGVYELTVRADAAMGGSPVSDTQVYTFVVGGDNGEVPAAVETTTTLDASATKVTLGSPVTLTSTVNLDDADDAYYVDGAVEFRAGSTVLGHDAIDESGAATLTLSNLPVGAHDVTAVFIPALSGVATSSTSAPVTVTVAAAPVVKPPAPVVKVDPIVVVKTKKVVRRGAKATVKVAVRAQGVVATGKVRLKVGKKTVTVNLKPNGTAKAKVELPRKVGKTKVVATYLGDARVLADKGTTKVKVTR